MQDREPKPDRTASVDPTLTIIISCYNTRDLVRDCLSSIVRSPPGEPYEIVLVDDASTDGTSEMVRASFPEVHLLRNDVNQSYARSNNWALDHARGEFVLLLNNDTIVAPHALDRMIAFLREHPEAGMVGAKLLNEDGSVQWSVKALPSAGAALFGARSIVSRLFPGNRFTRHYLLHVDGDSEKPFVAGLVSGAGSMMPRHNVETVGRLDEQFFYHIDADYCKRITEAGYVNYYLPTASITHLNHRGGSTASVSKRFRFLLKFEIDSYRYYRKHMRTSPWDPKQVVVALGLSLHFVALASAQICDELASAVRARSQPAASIDRRPIDG